MRNAFWVLSIANGHLCLLSPLGSGDMRKDPGRIMAPGTGKVFLALFENDQKIRMIREGFGK